MNNQPNRVPVDPDKGFAASEIDRGHRLKFRLNGELVHGFAGDSVLSAALASGITIAGVHGGEPIALDERFAPPVLPASQRGKPHLALPMERFPAIEGLNLETLGARRPAVTPGGPLDLVRLFIQGERRTLGHRFDAVSRLAGDWLDAGDGEQIETDTLVVGAGLAGLSAALAAAEAGERVIVIERRQYVGGDGSFFGVAEDDEPAHTRLPKLMAAIAEHANVEILLRTEALSLAGTALRAHQVVVDDVLPVGRQLSIRARRVVLATGAPERLPVFPGNRLPGVTGAMAAYHRAERFGVWIGHNALFSTVSNQAYRLAIRAADAGIGVQRAHDARTQPQSRFIDFSKATGVPLAFGLAPHAAAPAGRRKNGLLVRFALAMDEGGPPGPPQPTDQFVVSGGWQPDLSLWLTAGGGATWLRRSARLEAEGELPGVVLAGAAAGYQGTGACATSGTAAIAKLLGRPHAPVDDPQIDPIFESPDAPTTISPPVPGVRGLAYLDGGASLVVLPPAPDAVGATRRLGLAPIVPPLADQARALCLGDVAAAVQVGAIAPADAGAVVAERCIVPSRVVPARTPPPPPAEDAAAPYPAWLAARFGPNPALWRLDAIEGRAFEAGCLVHVNSDVSDPLLAVGVVLAAPREAGKLALALIGKSPARAGDRFVVRDGDSTTRVQLAVYAAPEPEPVVVEEF